MDENVCVATKHGHTWINQEESMRPESSRSLLNALKVTSCGSAGLGSVLQQRIRGRHCWHWASGRPESPLSDRKQTAPTSCQHGRFQPSRLQPPDVRTVGLYMFPMKYRLFFAPNNYERIIHSFFGIVLCFDIFLTPRGGCSEQAV